MKKTEPKLGITRHSFQKWGAKGGKQTLKKLGKKHFKKIGDIGKKKRFNKV